MQSMMVQTKLQTFMQQHRIRSLPFTPESPGETFTIFYVTS